MPHDFLLPFSLHGARSFSLWASQCSLYRVPHEKPELFLLMGHGTRFGMVRLFFSLHSCTRSLNIMFHCIYYSPSSLGNCRVNGSGRLCMQRGSFLSPLWSTARLFVLVGSHNLSVNNPNFQYRAICLFRATQPSHQPEIIAPSVSHFLHAWIPHAAHRIRDSAR